MNYSSRYVGRELNLKGGIVAEIKNAVQVEHVISVAVRHPIKAARLLYTAPSWVLRGPVYIIGSLVIVCLIYSFWARKDELVVAPLVLERESRTVEAVSSGMVSQVLVQEGDRVEGMIPMVIVQKTSVQDRSEKESLSSRREELVKELAKEIKEYEYNKKQLDLGLERTRLSLGSVEKDRALLMQQLEATQRNVAFGRKKLKQAQTLRDEDRVLFNARDITKSEFQSVESRVDDWEKSVLDSESEVQKIKVSLEALKKDKIDSELAQGENEVKRLNESHMERRKTLDGQLLVVNRQIQEEETLLRGVVTQGQNTTYSSPFVGTVTGIHVHSGAMVGAGARLFTLVKESAALEGRGLVQNRDIGRMKRGQEVKIKYFAYPYQEFGIPSGMISDIATRPGGVEGQANMYIVKVRIKDETIRGRDGRARPLEIGLEGIAEIKTGEKRFIELVFSPISSFFTQDDE